MGLRQAIIHLNVRSMVESNLIPPFGHYVCILENEKKLPQKKTVNNIYRIMLVWCIVNRK